jgi:hypothetical protein
MKRKTGDDIAKELEKVKDDIRDLNSAIRETEKGTLPYKLLTDALDAKLSENDKLERTVYIEATE